MQKLSILRSLGLPLTTIDTTKLAYSNLIARRLSDVDGDVQVLIEDAMARLVGIQTRLDKAITRSGIKSIDDIEFFGDSGGRTEMQNLRSEKQSLINDLANLLDIRVTRNSTMQKSVCIG